METSKGFPALFQCSLYRRSRIYILVVIACLAGIAISAELTRIHIYTHTDPTFHSLCAVSEGVNCETVALSPYSVFAGLPISVWGVMGYLSFGFLAAWGLIGPRQLPPWFFGVSTLLSTVFLCVSIILQFISWTRIDSICLFCLASAILNLALFILSAIALRGTRLRISTLAFSPIRCLFSNPPLAGAVLLTAAAAVAVAEAAVKPYWESPGWSDLPRLSCGIDGDGLHWIGAEDPEATIVEFSDYECPHCRKAHKKMRLLAAEYPKSVRLYHRHLPLDRSCNPKIKREFHKFACKFARAAECAGEQKKFWEMNDALFSIQDEIKSRDVDVELLAVKLGLDRSVFKHCMESDRPVAKIKKDVNAAMNEKLSGTPTFFIGKEKFVGNIPASKLKELLE
jgi:protein-disulfide isomerase/uncharacterized membrane protein